MHVNSLWGLGNITKAVKELVRSTTQAQTPVLCPRLGGCQQGPCGSLGETNRSVESTEAQTTEPPGQVSEKQLSSRQPNTQTDGGPHPLGSVFARRNLQRPTEENEIYRVVSTPGQPTRRSQEGQTKELWPFWNVCVGGASR